ncbi:Hypothetical Protein FCC1311_041762 [Hondaea fermentalgiana]|uniref:Uncharacterized protein n=1 Tax=Hondaea fermentalgiana TaxID=2315210 RepID=A0A2R5GH32_9STRA|nr:Hypothetical Protein FCC1311_041762 [Hondaea fermentalgiana]|eukprot:GBG27953.1 Hypothetical Protein FCC1311_041762 [Hondaea fermentalgiana]
MDEDKDDKDDDSTGGSTMKSDGGGDDEKNVHFKDVGDDADDDDDDDDWVPTWTRMASGGQLGAGPEALDDRVEAAREIQDLVRAGYRRLDPEFYAAAANKVERLPSGSLARRYLSGFIMNGHGNLVMAREGNTTEAGELLKGAFEHAMAEAAEGLGDDRYSDIVSFASDLAINFAANDRLPEAEQLLKRALYWVSSSRVEPDRPLLVATLSNLGQVQLLRNYPSTALDNFERAFIEAANLFGADNELVRPAMLTHLSMALRVEGISTRALEVSLNAVDAARTSYETLCKTSSHNERAQMANVLSAALINRALCIVDTLTNRDDVAVARALAQEAAELNPDAHRVSVLLIEALLADSLEESKRRYEEILMSAASPTVARAVRHNIGVMERLAAAQENEDDKTTETAASADDDADVDEVSETLHEDMLFFEDAAASNLLHRLHVPTLPANVKETVWVQSESAFVHGLTLRAFCKERTFVDEKEDNKSSVGGNGGSTTFVKG